MTFEGGVTFGVIVLTFVMLILTRISADIIMMAALTCLLASGVLTAQEALIGFANEGMITVAVLYVVANGLYETGVVSTISNKVLGRPSTARQAQFRLMPPVAFLSAFLNNTPVVAMFVPMVAQWAKRYKLDVSQLMIPLSYAAIIGGTCTLIGTSTNLILNSMLKQHNVEAGLGMFELSWVGVPCAIIVIGLTVLFGRWLLPENKRQNTGIAELRQYSVEMSVEFDSPLAGQTIEQAGLRNLPNMYLVSIEREGCIRSAVGPHEKLNGGDRLMFVGVVESVVDLNKIRGLKAVEDVNRHFVENSVGRTMVEAVVSQTCPLLSMTIKESRFRSHYNAAIVAVARNGAHIKQKIGAIKLAVGDTLLLDAPENFLEQQRYSKDFLLVSRVDNSQPVRHDRSTAALVILVLMVSLVATQIVTMLEGALIAAGAMLVAKCTTASIARKSIDWPVLVVIGASIALGGAVQKTGLAVFVAENFILSDGASLTLVLAKLFVVTALFTAILSNMTAAVLLFPIAIASSQSMGISEVPFVVTLMIAASASFATPIGYQTNLMVYGPGGYCFRDYVRAGLPMVVVVGLLSVFIIPKVWL